MKIRITMKDPDCLYGPVDDAINEWIQTIEDLSDHEKDALAEARKETVRSKLYKWFEYGEYLEVEVDTDAETCVVLENT